MQISNFGNGYQNGSLFRQVSIGHIVDYFQRAVVNLDLFGPGAGTVISLFLLISFFQAAHAGAQKGVV
ncbi:MAG: hypothetical protein WA183_20200 [Chthoniobacterales bacterium]